MELNIKNERVLLNTELQIKVTERVLYVDSTENFIIVEILQKGNNVEEICENSNVLVACCLVRLQLMFIRGCYIDNNNNDNNNNIYNAQIP